MSKYEYVFRYADIETYAPGSDPHYWYGGFVDEHGSFQWHRTFKEFWKAMTKKVKGKRVVVVFYNSKYDISILQYHARRELGYKLNPVKDGEVVKGQTKTIYTSQKTEVYTDNNLAPIFIVDAMPIMPGGLPKWGEKLKFPKGETPKVDEDVDPTDEEIEYLKRDCEILERAFQGLVGEEAVEKGLLTISSRTQYALKGEFETTRKGYSRHTSGLRSEFNGNELKKVDHTLPLPTAIKERVKAVLSEIKATEYKHSKGKNKRLYGLNKEVLEGFERKLKRTCIKAYSDEYENFREWQKEIAKLLEKQEKNEEEKQKIADFFGLELPSVDFSKLKLEEKIDKYHHNEIVASMNRETRAALRGGISYPNPTYKGVLMKCVAVLDVNSLYPYIPLEYEIPNRYVGSSRELEPHRSKYYVAVISKLKATLKDGYHPSMKRNTRYARDFLYEKELDWTNRVKDGFNNTALTSVDLDWLYECYEVHEIEYEEVFYYEADAWFQKAVRAHIRKWQKEKIRCEEEGDTLGREIAKMMLNTLWGRWGMTDKQVKRGGLKVDISDRTSNLVSASFTTAYARVYLNKMMNELGDCLIYTDTDSVHFHMTGKFSSKEKVEKHFGEAIHSSEFGKWSWDGEGIYRRGRYLKPKTYALESYEKWSEEDYRKGKCPKDFVGEYKVYATVAGGSKKSVRVKKLEDFHKGAQFWQLKNSELEDGRIVLQEAPFTL